MSATKRICHKEKCKTCNGTGLYSGMGERDGFAIICNRCDGTGCFEYVHDYVEFEERRPSKDKILRVFEKNPAVLVGRKPGMPEDYFGGMPYSDWAEGKPFPKGSEMRNYTCPAWWTFDPKIFDECREGVRLGQSFSDCTYFGNKEACWARYDTEARSGPDTGTGER